MRACTCACARRPAPGTCSTGRKRSGRSVGSGASGGQAKTCRCTCTSRPQSHAAAGAPPKAGRQRGLDSAKRLERCRTRRAEGSRRALLSAADAGARTHGTRRRRRRPPTWARRWRWQPPPAARRCPCGARRHQRSTPATRRTPPGSPCPPLPDGADVDSGSNEPGSNAFVTFQFAPSPSWCARRHRADSWWRRCLSGTGAGCKGRAARATGPPPAPPLLGARGSAPAPKLF